MESVVFKKNQVNLALTQARGLVRIADNNGNHIRKPTEGKNIEDNLIEWMITNREINKLVKRFFDKKDKAELITKLNKISYFIKNSQYATRETIKTTQEKIDKFGEFEVYKYTENFYSFEKQIKSQVIIRITFKMGDYTLAPHMFVLIPFSHPLLKITNYQGNVGNGCILGSKCVGTWSPNKEDIKEIIISLAHASDDHRKDLINILKS